MCRLRQVPNTRGWLLAYGARCFGQCGEVGEALCGGAARRSAVHRRCPCLARWRARDARGDRCCTTRCDRWCARRPQPGRQWEKSGLRRGGERSQVGTAGREHAVRGLDGVNPVSDHPCARCRVAPEAPRSAARRALDSRPGPAPGPGESQRGLQAPPRRTAGPRREGGNREARYRRTAEISPPGRSSCCGGVLIGRP